MQQGSETRRPVTPVVSQRRPYQPPRLTCYGSVTSLTGGGEIGGPDNGVTGSHYKIKS